LPTGLDGSTDELRVSLAAGFGDTVLLGALPTPVGFGLVP